MSSPPLHLTILGSGTSMGVPSLGCRCRVCTSTDPHDNRLRPSVLLSRNGQNVVIDTTPDFRQQALRTKMDRLDAILLTHGHADHILGFDDIRPFNIRQRTALPVYSNEETFRTVRRAFSYVFDDKPSLSTVPSVTLHEVSQPFELLGVQITPIPLLHGDMQVLGYRFGRAAYLTDFSAIPETSMALLEGLDELILDALRDIPHPMHQTVAQALVLVTKLKPKRAWFTHIAHDLPHNDTNERLLQMGFSNVQLAYDGLQFEVAVDDSADSPLEDIEAHDLLAGSRAPVSPGLTVFDSAEAWAARYGAFGRNSVLAIGNFDGIHLGHQSILRATVERAHRFNAVATALTFDPAPLKVLRPNSAPMRLSTNAQRTDWFAAVGLQAAVVLPFTMDLARLSPEQFVDEVLVRQLHVREVLVGEDFRFGHRQSGDAQLLRELGEKRNFSVQIVPPVVYRGEVVSSTIIRREIAEGDVTHAARLLGRPFVLTGEVVGGTATGRKLTVPTLNLAGEQELLPARGVYITRTMFEGAARSHRSVTNVGMRPTFDGTALTVETHLLDADQVIAPKRIEVRFWKKIRDEKKFASPAELRAQIARDIATTNRFFTRLRNLRSQQSLTSAN